MRLAVFGSTGGTGPFVLREAIRRGHEVTAFARRPEMLIEAPSLTSVVQGDARDLDAVAQAVAGQDAVILTVSGRGKPGVIGDIARTVDQAMRDAGVARLVATSSYGIVATRPYVVASLVRRAFATSFADQAEADEIIQGTALEWTIARASRLIDKPATRPARVSSELFRKGPYSLSRSAWADVLLDLTSDHSYNRRIVNVTG